MPTYRNTTPEKFVIRHYVGDRDRVITVTQDLGYTTNGTLGGERWTVAETHPDGREWSKTIMGSRTTAQMEALSFAENHRSEFMAAAARNDRPPAERDPLRGSVSVGTSPTISMTTRLR